VALPNGDGWHGSFLLVVAIGCSAQVREPVVDRHDGAPLPSDEMPTGDGAHESADGAAEPSGDPGQYPDSEPVVPLDCDDGPTSPVVVQTAQELADALAQSAPGTVIRLAPGTYGGKFVITASGTAILPITLCGPWDAILEGPSLTSGYTLHLDRASWWVLTGFTVKGGQKGIMLDGAHHNRLVNLAVHDVGMEAIHFRSHSSYNRLERSVVFATGLQTPGYGEGVYLGSAKSNWDTYTNGEPDRADFNEIVDNRIGPTSAESIDIKEGTTGGLVLANHFDGAGMSGANYADSWLDIKGNGYQIVDNIGQNALVDGFQTHVQVDGWGNDNVFRRNRAEVLGPGYGFNIHSKSTGTVIGCDNVVIGAALGLANIDCQ
jgi:hypothetical protein